MSACLKERKPDVRIVLADPLGSALYRRVKHGELKAGGLGSITEGIGIGRVTANLAGAQFGRTQAVRGDRKQGQDLVG